MPWNPDPDFDRAEKITTDGGLGFWNEISQPGDILIGIVKSGKACFSKTKGTRGWQIIVEATKMQLGDDRTEAGIDWEGERPFMFQNYLDPEVWEEQATRGRKVYVRHVKDRESNGRIYPDYGFEFVDDTPVQRTASSAQDFRRAENPPVPAQSPEVIDLDKLSDEEFF